MILRAVDGFEFVRIPIAYANQDGEFTIENIIPSKYYAEFQGVPDLTYLKSVRLDRRDVLGSELDLSNGGSGELEIVLRYGVANVRGTVRAEDSTSTISNSSPVHTSSSSNASVVLVPDVLNADGSGLRFGNADENGAFDIKQLSPGHYRAYAFAAVDRDEVQNPYLLRELQGEGVEVQLEENDSKQIQLSLISAEAFQRMVARVPVF